MWCQLMINPLGGILCIRFSFTQSIDRKVFALGSLTQSIDREVFEVICRIMHLLIPFVFFILPLDL